MHNCVCDEMTPDHSENGIFNNLSFYFEMEILPQFSPGNTNFSIFTIFGQSTRYIYRYSNNFTKYSKY